MAKKPTTQNQDDKTSDVPDELAEQASFIGEMSDEIDEPDEDTIANSAEGEETTRSDASSSSSSDAQETGDDTGSTGDNESGTDEDEEGEKAAASESTASEEETGKTPAKGGTEEGAGAGAPQDPSQTTTPRTQEEINQVYADWRRETETLLAEHHYKLTKEEIDEIEADPAKALPRHMARVYMDSVTAAISQITTHMPRLVRIVIEQDSASSKAENAFFEQWPELKEHSDTVVKIGQAYRQLNPNASEEEFINEVGAAAMVSLRLDPTNRRNGASNSTPKGNGRDSQQQHNAPFKPATSSPGALPKAPVDTNPFTQLDAEFDEESTEDFG